MASSGMRSSGTQAATARPAPNPTLSHALRGQSPNGGPGVEHRLSLIYNGGVVEGKISVNRFVEIVSTAPAKIFGLFPRKGTIAIGSDADIVIFDPEEEMTISAKNHHMNVDYSCYEGFKVRGVAKTVLSRGDLVIEDGKYVAKPGRGQYLKRGLFNSPK